MGAGVEFGILGSATVCSANGQFLEIARPRQRSALSILLLNEGHSVSKKYFIDALWGTRPPSDPDGALRSNFYGLRQVPGIKERLQTGRYGYSLALHNDDILDTSHFRDLVQQARIAELPGDAAIAVRLLQRALAAWGNPPLADVPATLPLQPIISELFEHRHEAQELLVDARLCLGQHHELVPSLISLATEQPLRERRWEQLMLALYRCGRQAEALDTFTRARTLLDEEYGIEAGASLRRLQQLILAGDPMRSLALTGPRQRIQAGTAHEQQPHAFCAPANVPHQLPAAPRHFTGRAAELKILADLASETSPVGSSPVVSVLCGPPGIGKTALGIHFAHKIGDRFPDGQLYIDLSASSSATDPASIKQAIRSVLAPLIPLPHPDVMTPAAEENLYRTILAQRQMLIMIDNAYDSAQVQPLIPAAPQSMVIVTSRRRLTSLVASHSARLMTLDTLSPTEAMNLLMSRLSGGNSETSEAALSEVSEACERLPLALVLAATRATAMPMFPLRYLAEELRDEQNRLDALRGGESSDGMRTALSWSYERLTSGEAHMFRVLGTERIRNITIADAAKLASVPTSAAAQALTGLANAHLIRESAAGQYEFSVLMSTYAAERAQEDDRWPSEMSDLLT